MTSATSLLRSDLGHFAGRFGLTRREQDLVFLLASGVSTDQSIANRLGISDNTVHNHFKKIFRKTRTGGKAELLALLIKDVMQRQAAYRPFLKRPHVLIADEDPELGRTLAATLEEKGMQVFQETVLDNVPNRLDEHHIDVMVIDITMPDKNGFSVLSSVRSRYRYNPLIFLITEIPGVSRDDCLAWGANEVFPKPVPVDDLVFAIFSHFVDSPYERNRLVRVDSSIPARIEDRFDVSIDNIGFGGAFIPLSRHQLAEASLFEPGTRISIRLDLEEEGELTVTGEIIWRKDPSRSSIIAGIGIKFVDLSASQKNLVENYVRTRHLLGFTPWEEPRREHELTQ